MAKKWGPDRGRKECSHEVRTHLRTYKVEIRFDRWEGDFFAQFNGKEFKDPSIRGLEALLLEKAEDLDHLEWEQWIAYKLLEYSNGYGSSYAKYQDGPGRSFVGIQFDCVDLSVPQKGIARRYRERNVDEDGIVESIDESHLGYIWDRMDKLVPFSAERWVTLRKVRMAIIDARKKLGELLDHEDQDEVVKLIDTAAYVNVHRIGEAK